MTNNANAIPSNRNIGRVGDNDDSQDTKSPLSFVQTELTDIPQQIIVDTPQNGGIHAAIARTATRSMALFFARPVRLFRPAKVNGWQTLKSLASQQGTILSATYIVSLVRSQGVLIIPKHFVPPMIVNAGLGAVLWGSYAEAGDLLEPWLGQHSLSSAALSGAIAGASQAIVAAPAENVRILLEQGFGAKSWSCAWKEVFRAGLVPVAPKISSEKLHEIRQLRGWLNDVGQMAGRGWNGWGWGCAKDTIGFGIFFFIFELSRRAGIAAKSWCQTLPHSVDEDRVNTSQLPAIANGVTLVSGGVIAGLAYEYASRPWDNARRVINLERTASMRTKEPSHRIVIRKVTEDGVRILFRLPQATTEVRVRWTVKLLRTAGRVGPWGAGFLVWEAYGNGLA